MIPPADPLPAQSRGITVGSACSGWCSELFALELQAKIFTSIFACDNNKACQHFINKVHQHGHLYADVCSDFLRAPRVDLFLAGFPCQPFSTMGRNCGLADVRGQLVLF